MTAKQSILASKEHCQSLAKVRFYETLGTYRGGSLTIDYSFLRRFASQWNFQGVLYTPPVLVTRVPPLILIHLHVDP